MHAFLDIFHRTLRQVSKVSSGKAIPPLFWDVMRRRFGSWLPKLWDSLSVPSSRVKKSRSWTLPKRR